MADYNLGTARGKIEIDANGVESTLAGASAATGKFTKNTEAASASLIGTGKVVGAFGIALAAGFGFAVKTAGDFEKRMSAVGAVSGATESQMEALREKALQLGADTAFSASESAMAMEELIKAGLTTEDVLNGAADATVALAAAGEVELPKAAELAANAMNQFNLSAEQMPKVADLIAGAANASAISVEEFGMSMSQAGAVANLAGFSFDDTATAIAAMGNAGIKGSDAGTSLKTMLSNLQPTTEKAAGALMDMGIILEDGTNLFYDREGQVKSLAEISELLADGTRDMTAAEKQMALEMAFGSDAIRAAAVFANEGADGINNLAGAMGKVTAADVAAKRMDNLAGSIEQLKGSFETMMIQMGSAFQEPIRKLVDGLTSLINSFTELSPSTQRMIGLFVAGGAAVLTAAGAFLAAAGYVMKLVQTARLLSAALAANPAILITAAIIALGVALFAAYKKFEGFRKVVDTMFDGVQALFGPLVKTIVDFATRAYTSLKFLFDIFKSGKLNAENFGAVMQSIFGGGNGVAEFFTGLYESASKAFKWINDNVVPIVNRVVEALGGWGNVLKIVGAAIAAAMFPIPALIAAVVYLYQRFEWFKTAVNAIFKTIAFIIKAAFIIIKAIILGVIDAFKALVDGVKAIPGAFRAVRDGVADAVSGIASAVTDFLEPLTTWIQENVFPVFTAFGELVAATVKFIIAAWKFLWPAIEFGGKAIIAILNVLLTVFKYVAMAIGAVLYVLAQIVKTVFNGVIVPAFKIAFSAIQAAFRIFADIFTAAWRAFSDNIKDVVTIAWNLIKGTIESVLKFIQGLIQLVTGIISGDWSKAWTGIKNMLAATWDFMANIVRNAFALIRTIIDAALSAIRFLWDAAWSIIKNVLSTAWNAMKTAVSAGVDAVIGFIKAVPGRAVSALGNIISTLAQKGSDLMQGFLNGIKLIWSEIWDFFLELPSKIVDIIGNLGRLLYDIGRDIINGLLDGIKAAMGAVEDFVGGIGSTITSLKGPPEYDKIMLVENGQLIMQGLLTGMRDVWPAIQNQLKSYSSGIPGMVTATGGVGGGGIHLNFDFRNGTFAPGAEQAIRDTVSDPSLLNDIIRAAKAGAGRN